MAEGHRTKWGMCGFIMLFSNNNNVFSILTSILLDYPLLLQNSNSSILTIDDIEINDNNFRDDEP